MRFHLKDARLISAFAHNDVRRVFAQHTGANGYHVYLRQNSIVCRWTKTV